MSVTRRLQVSYNHVKHPSGMPVVDDEGGGDDKEEEDR